MVKSVTSLTRNGLRDWLVQNITAAFMAIYIISLVIYVMLNPVVDYYAWHALFSSIFMRISTLLFLFFLILHTRIGLWTIATDYLKPTAIRMLFLAVTSLVLVGSFLWAISILWGL
ncbi:MAG TPA: succinate dehydrogenase, hydrophobic membrane anchor protein [Gammaproteobacteria bacterium]|nr:succinate dehydrogenase, hydrophobic membrane anchor protein [Gammaproteobacteria bacterium]